MYLVDLGQGLGVLLIAVGSFCENKGAGADNAAGSKAEPCHIVHERLLDLTFMHCFRTLEQQSPRY